ncbi:DUF481 domain-containing protein [Paraferrimonas sedimenticola]|uniref:Salt-induced outer membrane protein n=1 Tax=Paraferrimonas sedimenticola TaxID=375674 RepID=A0AA37RVT3_9GAMM|nr:DUF481 domain-containing protein [Paraferrimonas sedimenticola]GLP95729.1 hypothetical protein GCM10007895_10350 [Paraferrimonas sedimenticola]
MKANRLALLALVVSPAWAIVPPEYQDPSNPFSAEVEMGLQLTTGNTVANSFNGRTKVIYDTLNAKQEGNFRAYFASDSEKITAQQYQLQFQSDRKFADGDYLYGRGDLTWDEFGSFTRQYIFSTGYGFDVLQNSRSKLSFEAGPGYRLSLPQVSADVPKPEDEREVIARGAAKFEHKLQEYTTFNADLVSEVGEKNTVTTLDLSYKNLFFKDWALKVGLFIKHNRVVPEGSKNTDTITTVNLLYTFQ